MKVVVAFGFMKLHVGLIFVVIDNRLTFLLSIYIITSLVIQNTLSIHWENQTKIVKIKKAKVNT